MTTRFPIIIRPMSSTSTMAPPTTTTTLLPDSTLVESKLLSLENVAVHTTALARPGRNNGVQATSLELPLKSSLDLAGRSESSTLLLLDALALLLLSRSLGARLLLPTTAQSLAVVCLVPLSERCGVDLDDGRSGQGVCADELVVGRVEGDCNDADLAGNALRAPGKVAAVEAQGTEFAVAAAGAHEMDSLGTDTGVGGLAALLESSAEDISVWDGHGYAGQKQSVYAYLFLR